MAAPYTQLAPSALPGRRYGSFAGKVAGTTVVAGLDYTVPTNFHHYTVVSNQPRYTVSRNQTDFTVPPNQMDYTLPEDAADFSV
jgi:hypothetical protein